jgi:L-rhamnonate dehydratase
MEDSLTPEDFNAHLELRRRIPWQTLATGEHWYTTLPFQQAASKHVVDIMQPDINWVGGMTALVKICAIAEASSISVIPHGVLCHASNTMDRMLYQYPTWDFTNQRKI